MSEKVIYDMGVETIIDDLRDYAVNNYPYAVDFHSVLDNYQEKLIREVEERFNKKEGKQ